MGMRERDEYLATRVIGDRFYALDTEGRVTSWCLVTGKYVD
jgi:hypothetical protein